MARVSESPRSRRAYVSCWCWGGSPVQGQSSKTELERSEALADYSRGHFLLLHKEKFRFAAPIQVIPLQRRESQHQTRFYGRWVTLGMWSLQFHFSFSKTDLIFFFFNSYICELQKKKIIVSQNPIILCCGPWYKLISRPYQLIPGLISFPQPAVQTKIIVYCCFKPDTVRSVCFHGYFTMWDTFWRKNQSKVKNVLQQKWLCTN